MAYTGEPAGGVVAPPFDLATAAAFLHEQAECLAAGLRSMDDPLAVRAVLRSHDGSHDTWLSLIAAVRQDDPATADVLATLYAFHGQVAGSLERAARDQRHTPLRHVCGALSQRLEALTSAAVAALETFDRWLLDRRER